MTFDSIVQSDSPPPINECCQIKSKLLQMMPPFPSPSLKFRTAGFPQYGFKAGVSGETFPMRHAA
jgi:hypothetical protein